MKESCLVLTLNVAVLSSVGSLFYAIYFFVSFPMFYRIDEEEFVLSRTMNATWPLSRIVIDSLAASMLVTILLDLWRLMMGPLIDTTHLPSHISSRETLPWLR